MADNENQYNPIASLTTMLYSLSFYAPLIMTTSILTFSMFSSSLEKGAVYLLWIFIITFLRIIVLRIIQSTQKTRVPVDPLPAICSTGLTDIFIPNDITYSTYILSFTMFYFVMPMIMVSNEGNTNAMNYYVIGFFIAYIILDLFIKKTLSCVSSLFSVNIFADIVSGVGLGAVIAGPIMYGTTLRNYLFINEVNSNNEVCTMPTKQQFRCNVYKNGELVGSTS